MKMSSVLPSAAPLGYYRTPALYENILFFAAEGDLWRVGSEGGVASRVTSHLGDEHDPAASPDGLTLAYSASYEGPEEIYAMPVIGGVPKRLTFDGTSARVVGWTPGGEILYATGNYSALPNVQLMRLNPLTGEKRLIPLSQASDGVYDEAEKTLFFTRFAAQSSHTKRYKGGTAQNIWKYVEGDAEATPLTADFTGTSRHPMLWEGRVYFATDRSGAMNLWSMDADGDDLRQATFHQGWDVTAPYQQNGRIAYQLGADLWIFDIASGETRKVEIALTSDFDQMREVWVKNPISYLTSTALSPKGDKIALTARGQVFVAPAKQGRIVEATRNPGVRYRAARFAPDGKSLLAFSDESGEVELWRLPANGAGDKERLTENGDILRWESAPSPDGKRIAHHDKKRRLWLLNAETKEEELILTNPYGDIGDLRWSPDSRWLAFSQSAPNTFAQISLYGTETGTITPVTSDRFNHYSPTWSRDGEWLYFLSDRNLKTLVPSPWGTRQPEPFMAAPWEIFALALKKEHRFPFRPNDELHPPDEKSEEKEKKEKTEGEDEDESKKDEEPKKDEKSDAPKPVEIDFDGIVERLYKVPVSAGNYYNLSADEKRLYWIASDSTFESKRALKIVAIGSEKIETKTFMEDIGGYELSASGKKLMVRKKDDLYVFDAGDKAPDKLEDFKVDLSRWSFPFSLIEEMEQLFIEAWRLERDYFYDPNMHGVDWPAMLEKYRPLLPRVTTRGELNDLIAQMVSELSALHIFVGGGDIRQGNGRVEVASLGCDWERDEKAGGYRIMRIYRADPDLPEEASPLAKPDLQIREGDVIERINGVETLSAFDPGQLLRNQANRQTLLRVLPGDAPESPREAIVTAISQGQAFNLRYSDWEYGRRLKTEELSGGRIGYVHLRAMGGGNYEEWARNFYPAFNREGLILDVRNNSGGNIDSWILSKLLRKAWFYWQDRSGMPSWNMQYAFRGHLIALVNERTASDGEALSEGVKRLELGEVMGIRTWGGEIWLTGSNVLRDRGVATAAEFGVYGPEGEWLIEGHGVEPDYVVDNLPRETFDGRDRQLEAAVERLLKRMTEEPIPVPPYPPYPDKSLRFEDEREGLA